MDKRGRQFTRPRLGLSVLRKKSSSRVKGSELPEPTCQVIVLSRIAKLNSLKHNLVMELARARFVVHSRSGRRSQHAKSTGEKSLKSLEPCESLQNILQSCAAYRTVPTWVFIFFGVY
jgi:hypothetical protein